MTDNDIIKAMDIFKRISLEFRYEKICELSNKQKDDYKILLDEFKRVNRKENKATAALKGKALEELATYLLLISGGIFTVNKNLRTCTNEIDQIIRLAPNGNVLHSLELINLKLQTFISECKNHDCKIGVTYIGKFCSLLLTNNVTLGLLFSYHGVTGSGWTDGTGLIKKFYLHKEQVENRFCIIDFNIDDFESILNGKNLLQIIDDRLSSMQFDTDYSRYLAKHPAE